MTHRGTIDQLGCAVELRAASQRILSLVHTRTGPRLNVSIVGITMSRLHTPIYLRILAVLLGSALFTGCTPHGASPDPELEKSLVVDDYLFVSKDTNRAACPPGIYLLANKVSALTQAIAEGESFDLANDTLTLPLLDSMLNGHDEQARRFYFWIVTRSLKKADGYYSEAVGSTGTAYLMTRPDEFISLWENCIGEAERLEWAYYLAAEEHIGSEGYAPETVMRDYRQRVDGSTATLPTTLLGAKSELMNAVDSIYRNLAAHDRPLQDQQ